MSEETKPDPWMRYSNYWWTCDVEDVLILHLHQDPGTIAYPKNLPEWKAVVENQDCREMHSSIHGSREEAERAVKQAAREVLAKAMDALKD